VDERFEQEAGLRRAVLAGDETAWTALYGRCFGPLFNYVHWRCGGNRTEAEEIVQEVWLIAVRRIRWFSPERAPFLVWLRGIADKTLLNHRRKWARRRRLQEGEGEGLASPSNLQTAVAAEAALVADEVAVAMGQLPERYQAVLRAKYGEQRAVSEIAAQWGATVKTVESLLTRARGAFREAYTRTKH